MNDREGWRGSLAIPALNSCLSTETAESALSRNRGVDEALNPKRMVSLMGLRSLKRVWLH
ncbi:MAG: hypothetical protein AAFQ80_04670 [Cyanobacteria bacterium J06621_8]